MFNSIFVGALLVAVAPSVTASSGSRAVLVGDAIAPVFPPAAIATGESGRVVATYTIDTDGRVSSCSARGVGPILDAETCRLIVRLRFKPATDVRGHPVAETRTQPMDWRVPPLPTDE